MDPHLDSGVFGAQLTQPALPSPHPTCPASTSQPQLRMPTSPQEQGQEVWDEEGHHGEKDWGPRRLLFIFMTYNFG